MVVDDRLQQRRCFGDDVRVRVASEGRRLGSGCGGAEEADVANRWRIAEQGDREFDQIVEVEVLDRIGHSPRRRSASAWRSITSAVAEETRKVGEIAVYGPFSPGQGRQLVKEGAISGGFMWNPMEAGRVFVRIGDMLVKGEEITDGTTIALKAETHNHPSAVEPFGGANTGVGGVIRDVLGPTSTNWERPYEYEVPWDQFLACWWAQGNDGQAIGERGSFKG